MNERDNTRSKPTPGEIRLGMPVKEVSWGTRRANNLVMEVCRDAFNRDDCTVEDFVRLKTWMKFPNIGPYTEDTIHTTLGRFGLHKGMSEEELDVYRRNYGKPEAKANDIPVTVPVTCHEGTLPETSMGPGNWLELSSAENVDMKKGDFRLISLGISIELPPDHTAYLIPCSGTFARFGILPTEPLGVVDSAFCEGGNIIRFPALATRDVRIPAGAEIARITVLPNASVRWVPAKKSD